MSDKDSKMMILNPDRERLFLTPAFMMPSLEMLELCFILVFSPCLRHILKGSLEDVPESLEDSMVFVCFSGTNKLCSNVNSDYFLYFT